MTERYSDDIAYPDPQIPSEYNPLINTGREKLDSFPKGTIDLKRMRELALRADRDASFLDWISDPDAIPRSLTTSIPVPGPTSDLRPSFVKQMMQAGVIKKMGRREHTRGMVGVFTTPKKNPLFHRTIVDGRPINRAMSTPPRFSLFSPPLLFDKLRTRGAKWGAVVDMKGWFHQFPMCDVTASFFVFRVENTWYRWTRLPMGWTFAPFVAQQGAETLVQIEDAAVYLDDIFVFGATKALCAERVTAILERMRYAQAEINEEKSTLTPQQTVVYIGVEWNLPLQSFRFPLEWRTSTWRAVADFNTSPHHSIREAYKIFGLIMRILHVMSSPLCFSPTILHHMGKWAHVIAKGSLEWDSTITVTTDLRQEIKTATDYIATDEWYTLPPRVSAYQTVVYTDASTRGRGVVWQKIGDTHASEAWGSWHNDHSHTHIFALEAAAAAKGVALAGGGAGGILLLTDNKGLAYCVAKGRSRTRIGSMFLREIFSLVHPLHLRTEWISTDVMPADELSRRLGTGGTGRAPLQQTHIRRDAQGFSFSEVV